MCTAAIAQDAAGCDQQRYRTYITDNVSVTADILYGAGNLFPTEVPVDLYFDVYEPFDDTVEERPVVVVAFGGSFIDGTRQDMDFVCRDLAQRGYVAVSIDYRLYDGPLFPLPTATTMRNVVIRAVSDMKGAIRYLRQDADQSNTYGIDPSRIYVGGISAGSILASHVAMLDDTDDLPDELRGIIDSNGGLEGNSNDITGYGTEVSGLINYSGGLNDASWIDADDPVFFSVHDENDGVVPYAGGFATVFGFPIIYMEGSALLKEVADSVGVYNELITFENSVAHVGFLLNEQSTLNVFNSTAAFLHAEVCPAIVSSTGELTSTEISVYPNPATGLVNITLSEDEHLTRVELSNTTGLTYELPYQGNTVDIAALPSGLYTLTAYTTAGGAATTKLVVH